MRPFVGPIAALVFAATAMPAQAEEACRIRVEALQGTDWEIEGYDLFDQRPPRAVFTVNFVHVAGPSCTFVPRVDVVDGLPGLKGPNGQRVPYSLVASDGSTGIQLNGLSLSRVPSNNASSITLTPGSSRSVTFDFFVPENSLQGDGLYRQDIEVSATSLGQRGPAFGVLLAKLGIDVVPSARLGLAGSFRLVGSQAIVDLGELRTGPVQGPLQLHVRSTRRFEISVESQNAGKLKIPSSEWAVAYAMKMGGIDVPLTGGIDILSPQGPNGLSRTALPIQFTITGDPTTQRAGRYEDVLTISVTPKI